jgi:nucleoside-diphosphate-sugar epimerase
MKPNGTGDAPSARTVVVTGAGGFVGRRLCDRFRDQGRTVRALVRDPSRGPFREGVEPYLCNLPDRIDAHAFAGADAVVHLAWATRHTTIAAARRVDEEGSASVLRRSRDAGVKRFVFLSTTSAGEHALSYYGRSKLAVEQRLDPERDTILRAGLVLGRDGGLFRRLARSVERGGIAPLIDGGRQIVQPVHVDDLCLAVERVIDRDLPGRYVVADPVGVPLRELLARVAEISGRRIRFVPLPSGPLLALLRVAEALRIRLPVSSENLLGLRALRVQPSADDLRTLGIEPRSLQESLEELVP